MKFNFNHVLDWVKTNLVIVIFSVVIIAAPITMFFISSGMNKKVRDEVQKRGGTVGQLTNLSIDLPSGEKVVPTENLLAEYERVAKVLADDAAAVQKRALEFNRKGRDVLMPGVFPEPPYELRQIIPLDFHNRLNAAYRDLLREVNAGSPPDLESLRQELESMRVRFIAQDLKKDPSSPLDPAEVARLQDLLSDARLDRYKRAAANVGLYATIYGLFVPPWNQARIPSAAEMFNWQWQYWAVEDALKALASANKDASSVATAPVKRLLGVVVSGLPRPAGDTAAGSGVDSTPRLSGGFGEGDQAPAGDDDQQGGGGVAGPLANPKAPVPRNFATSLAGLVSNPLFDVLTIDMAIVVETAQLPKVLDAISRYNFNTIINLRVETADQFAATEQGFFYGGEPVCTVTIRMQSVWLREWTTPFMPPATREALGIAAPLRPDPSMGG